MDLATKEERCFVAKKEIRVYHRLLYCYDIWNDWPRIPKCLRNMWLRGKRAAIFWLVLRWRDRIREPGCGAWIGKPEMFLGSVKVSPRLAAWTKRLQKCSIPRVFQVPRLRLMEARDGVTACSKCLASFGSRWTATATIIWQVLLLSWWISWRRGRWHLSIYYIIIRTIFCGMRFTEKVS
jgi:hypothetical protein